MSESKINELESKNIQLKTENAALATRNAQLEAMAFDSEEEIDLKELWNVIWQGKWIIVGVTSIIAIASIIYTLSLSNEYKSTAILAPAAQSGSAGGLAKLAGQFGGLASLAGVNLGGGAGEDKTSIAIELIKTWGFQEKFIEDQGIQAEVFAATGWNRITNELSYDNDLYNPDTNQWVREFDSSIGETAEPSSWELYEEFSKRVSVSQDKNSGLVNISVEFYSPYLAKHWTEELVKAINLHLKMQDRKEAQKSISFLKKQVESTNIAGMQSVFYQLIEEQTKKLMLAEVSEEYVFKTISEAKSSEKKSKPNRAIMIILTTLIGGFVSVVCLLVVVLLRKQG